MIGREKWQWAGCIALALVVNVTLAEAPDAQATQPAKPPTLAVLNFQSNLAEPPNSGELIAEITSVRLGAIGDIRVVERQDIEKIIAEQKLSLAGLVSESEAIKVGKLLGAQLLLTGRVTSIGQNTYTICRVISSETSQVKGLVVSFPQNATMETMLDKTVSELANALPGFIDALVPKDQRGPSDVAVLKTLMKAKAMPTLAVVISEQHRGQPMVDPAAETEFKYLLTQIGMTPVALAPATVVEVMHNSSNYPRLSQLLAGTRYLIVGEGFSEPAGAVQGLVISLARLEVNVIDLETGKILFSDRVQTRTPDLAEYLAAKTSLQKAGRELAMRLLPKLIERLPPAPAP